MKFQHIFFLLTLFLLSSCASPKIPEPQPQFDDSRVYDASYDEVWSDLMEFFANNEVPLVNTDKESGYIKTERMRFDSNTVSLYAWSGYKLPTKRVHSGLIRATVFVKEEQENKTSVKVNTSVRLFKDYCCVLDPGGWFDAGSGGELELAILNSIKSNNPQQVDLKKTIDESDQ